MKAAARENETMKTMKTMLVMVTAGSEENAVAIARAIVEERLAACANIVAPVRSIYRWKEAVQDNREFLILIKTQASLFTALQRRVRELHSYEVPEVIALPIATGSKPYLDWLIDSTSHGSQPLGKARTNDDPAVK